ncbi:hypothetical protein DB30_04895 [Enhygromyxa salina]|uniref:Uncharacterized protein n=1 Tax=Enhygromyxa salina TaxID=215803 RepID=A0A0C2D849_9BACT|nr:hypothetical protein [Enhygromyxa salina]KIG16177.1 hypothetical protein DB30_04895 [Enhygromyxa salina]
MSDLQLRSETDEHSRSRRRVRTLRDLVVFQVKLLLEGFKDIVLGPLSLGAALLDFIAAKQAPDRYLDTVMRLGRRYEDALDLYGALGEPGEPAEVGGPGSGEPAQLAVAIPENASVGPGSERVRVDLG